jgi:hypothetical protein
MVIRNPQYRMVWDLISAGITRSASLAKVNAGNRKADKRVSDFFIKFDFWLKRREASKSKKVF